MYRINLLRADFREKMNAKDESIVALDSACDKVTYNFGYYG